MMPQSETVLRNETTDKSRNLRDVRWVVIDADGELGPASFDGLSSPFQERQLGALYIRFEERDVLIAEDRIQAIHGNVAGRIINAGDRKRLKVLAWRRHTHPCARI